MQFISSHITQTGESQCHLGGTLPAFVTSINDTQFLICHSINQELFYVMVIVQTCSCYSLDKFF